MPVGFMVGLPLGPIIRYKFGYVTLFLVAAIIILIAILYVLFILKETIKRKPKECDDDGLQLRLNKGI